MNTSNIDDPLGVAALLEQLKSSAAWQELTAAPATSEAESSVKSAGAPEEFSLNAANDTLPVAPAPSISGSSVASLLSQLESFSTTNAEAYQAQPTVSSAQYGYQYNAHPSAPLDNSVAYSNPSPPLEDRRNLTFRQSLPIISQLVDDPSVVASIKEMKKNQDILERRLHEERENIYTKYRDKVKVAQTKAKMIGTTVSQHELNMITDAFKKEISKFDLERVLPAWDGLVSRQQQELTQLSVPTMFVTSDAEDRKRQQQVVELLFTLLGPKGT